MVFNDALAVSLEFDPETLRQPDQAALFTGNLLPPGARALPESAKAGESPWLRHPCLELFRSKRGPPAGGEDGACGRDAAATAPIHRKALAATSERDP